MPVSNFYSDKYEKRSYGGKEYDVFFFEEPNILINDVVDSSIATCELTIDGSTWYTQTKTAPDGKIYRVGNENATTEQIKIYPYCGAGSYNNSAIRTLIWRYGTNMYKPTGSGIPSYLPDLKINDFVTQYNINITNAETGETRLATIDDYLNPPDNFYVTSLNSMTTFMHNYNTNRFESSMRGIRPHALMSGETVGGTIDLIDLMLNNESVSYDLSTGDQVSSGSGYKLIKNLKSLTQMTPLLKELPVTYNEKTFYSGDVWTIITSFSNNRQEIRYATSFKFVVKLLQSIGCYISVKSKEYKTFSADALKNDIDCIIGEMDSNGSPTFKWLTATDRVTSTSPNLNSDYKTSDSTYTPADKPEKDNITPPTYRFIDEIGGFTMYYKCNLSDLLTVVRRVNFPDESHPIPEGWEFTPHLVSCTQYPFNVSNYADGTTGNIVIGKWDSGVSAINLSSTQSAVKTIADFTLRGLNGNFLDYSPYSQYQLYIPLCGWVDLPDCCVNKQITVELATDVINNSCVSTVKADGLPVVHKAGVMGTSIAISATENGLKQAALTQSLFNTVGAVTSTGYALATQNAIGVVNGLVNAAGALTQGNIANNSNYTRQTGSTGDKSDKHISNTCYLKISSVVASEPDNYGHVVGYMCNKTKQLSTCSGFTVCSNVDTSGLNCNQSAKDRIKRMLETGIYI